VHDLSHADVGLRMLCNAGTAHCYAGLYVNQRPESLLQSLVSYDQEIVYTSFEYSTVC